jgi:hypothetical protein
MLNWSQNSQQLEPSGEADQLPQLRPADWISNIFLGAGRNLWVPSDLRLDRVKALEASLFWRFSFLELSV